MNHIELPEPAHSRVGCIVGCRTWLIKQSLKTTPMNSVQFAIPLILRKPLAALFAIVFALPAFGQTTNIPMTIPITAPAGMKPPLMGASIEASTVFSSEADYRNQKRGGSAASNLALAWNGNLPLSNQWIVPLDLMAQNISFGELPDTPVPDSIHPLSLNTGLIYKMSEDLMLMGRFGGTVYRTSEVGAKDIGFSAGLMGMWRYSPALTYVFGLMVNPDSDHRAFPMIGVNWDINEQLNLSLTLPRPRLTYRPNKDWSFHVGANINGATFRTSETMGTKLGDTRYNGVLGSYRDIRVGAGLGHSFTPSLSVEAEAGISVNREINYQQIRENVRFGPAPYLSLGLKFGF
ncbi:MAG: DUF6268 family outer membrane beta-barrel protein [bacterium]